MHSVMDKDKKIHFVFNCINRKVNTVFLYWCFFSFIQDLSSRDHCHLSVCDKSHGGRIPVTSGEINLAHVDDLIIQSHFISEPRSCKQI